MKRDGKSMTNFTKDPSTHPANGPLTEERLIRVREWLQSSLAYSEGSNRDYMMADAAKAIDELLALREVGQDPVYQVRHGDQWRDLNKAQYDDHVNLGAEGLRIVYVAPQLPQPSVMTPDYSQFLSDVMTAAGLLSHGKRDKALATSLSEFCIAERMRMDAPCRAAPLQGAEPVSQPYKLHYGWVAVPVEPTESMIIAGFEAELREELRDSEAWEAFEAMSGCEQAALRAKWCWAAMITAAPQKEVE